MNITNQIKTALQQYLDALQKKDWKTFEACLEDNFQYFTDNSIIQNKAEFLAFMKADSWQGSEYSITDFKTILSKNEDMVVATYKTSFTGTFGQEKITFGAIETTVFIKIKDTWKIRHTHTSNKV